MTTQPSPQPYRKAPQASLRDAGKYAFNVLMLAGAAGGMAVAFGYGVIVLNFALGMADRVRSALGFVVVPGEPDGVLLTVMATFVIVPVVALALVYHHYDAVWRKRSHRIWGDAKLARRHAKLPGVLESHRPAVKARQRQYLRDLALAKALPDLQPQAGDIGDKQYRRIGEAILKDCEAEIAERALVTGLTVGISQNRFIDHITIVLASLELQLHVMSSLGRRPGLRSWYQLITRAGSSLFANTYLNREDAFLLAFTTKGIATGMSAAAGAIEDMDLDEAFDTAEAMLQRFATGDISGAIVNSALSAVELSVDGAMSIGSTGLNLMSQLIEKSGDDLFQGVLAGGMLYYHGMALAGDSLAVDDEHRRSAAMSRTPVECMTRVAEYAGLVVLDYVRRRRKLLREKKRKALERIPCVRGVMKAASAAGDATRKTASIVVDTGIKVKRGAEAVTEAAAHARAKVTSTASAAAAGVQQKAAQVSGGLLRTGKSVMKSVFGRMVPKF